MPTVNASSVIPSASGVNEERRPYFRAAIPPALAADTIQITLPTRFQKRGFGLVGLRLQKFGAGAAGARTRTDLPYTALTYNEATGLISFTTTNALDGAGGNEAWIQLAEANT